MWSLLKSLLPTASKGAEGGTAVVGSSDLGEWVRLAEQGDIVAQRRLGDWFAAATNIPTHERRAFFWYLKAALQGDDRAQCELGRRYAQGLGTQVDWGQAGAWFRRAALQGNATAQFNLACLFLQTSDSVESKDQARYWFGCAARQGDGEALKCLQALGGPLPDELIQEMAQQAPRHIEAPGWVGAGGRKASLQLPVLDGATDDAFR